MGLAIGKGMLAIARGRIAAENCGDAACASRSASS
jgi:hypothetical protein